MATLAPAYSRAVAGDRFFANLALAMVVVVVAGFSMNLAMGRSSFGAPLLTHLHAVAFMAWLGLFVVQTRLGVGESRAMHKRLGWFAAGLALVLIPLGFATVVSMVRRDVTPFFFQPQHLLIADSIGLLGFVALTFAALRFRKQTDWHSRLHIGAMTMLMGPGIGRLLPMPFLVPYAFEAASIVGLIFPLIGALRDKRRNGRVHPAWWVVFAVVPLTLLLARAVTFSPVGDAIYAQAVAGSPGEAIDGRAMALHRLPPEMRAAIYGK